MKPQRVVVNVLQLLLVAAVQVNGFTICAAPTTRSNRHNGPLSATNRRHPSHLEQNDSTSHPRHQGDTGLNPTRMMAAAAPTMATALLTFFLSTTVASAADFAKKDISGMDFSGQDLSNKDFTSTIAKNTNFHNANLQGAIFTKANLEKADLSGANVKAANFVDATLDGASFKDAVAERATFSASILDVADLENVDLTDSMWPSK
eukprot:scaffold5771_cov171-Amphora_coffeaeformis.AAC.17